MLPLMTASNELSAITLHGVVTALLASDLQNRVPAQLCGYHTHYKAKAAVYIL